MVHTEIQQGLYRISGYRVAGQHSRATGYRVLPVPESLPVPECTSFRFSADSIHLHRELPVPECTSFISSAENRFTCTENYRVRSVAGPGVLPVPECTSLKSSADNRFTCTEDYRFRSVTASGVLQVTMT